MDGSAGPCQAVNAKDEKKSRDRADRLSSGPVRRPGDQTDEEIGGSTRAEKETEKAACFPRAGRLLNRASNANKCAHHGQDREHQDHRAAITLMARAHTMSVSVRRAGARGSR